MERSAPPRWGPLLLVLLMGWPAAAARAEDEPIEVNPRTGRRVVLTQKEYKSRLSKLRTAASRWIVARVEFPSRCPLCKGAGKATVRAGHRVVSRTCNQCKGNRAWISPKHYRKVYFDMRTPAFQALPGIKDTLGEQYKLASSGKPWPTMVKRYRMRDRVMVDDRHGIVYFLFNASKVPVETRWIWAEIPARKGAKKKKYQWYAYDARSDGPWPKSAAGASASDVPTDGSGWTELERSEAAQVRRAIARARISFRAEAYFKQGETLRVHLRSWDRKYKRALTDRVAQDAVQLSRAVLDATDAFDRVESQWTSDWEDPYGQVQAQPTWLATLDRRTNGDALWSTRTPLQQVSILTWRELQHAGWTAIGREPIVPRAVEPEPEPSPVEPSPTEPSPTEPTPTRPEPPTPVRPTPVRPTPPRPAPPPMPTPPPIEPRNWEPPTPSSSQLKKGRKGIEHMELVFKDAIRAHDEGVGARQEGAHDLWQEKLSEARSAMGEMDEIWIDEVVAAMPGGDEGEQEEVANEAFGEIWDKVDKLRSMVRKMSAIK